MHDSNSYSLEGFSQGKHYFCISQIPLGNHLCPNHCSSNNYLDVHQSTMKGTLKSIHGNIMDSCCNTNALRVSCYHHEGPILDTSE